MVNKDTEKMVQAKMSDMSNDAEQLHKLIRQRTALLKKNVLFENEEKDRNSKLSKIREQQSSIRSVKNDAKELERLKLSRTIMANLISSADYPECPPYVPHIINVLKNMSGIILLPIDSRIILIAAIL